MDATKTTKYLNPREKTNFISVLLWTWTVRFFKTGYNKVLNADDLYDPLKTDRSDGLGDRLEKHWYMELEKSKKSNRQASFLRTIFRCFAFEYFLFGILHAFNEFVLRLGTPILLGRLLRYFRENGGVTYHEALAYAGGICLATAANAITINQSIFGAFHVGGRIRIAVCSVVYRKALRLSRTALGETAPGKVVNLVANDVNRFDLVSIFFHHMWSAPLQTIIIGYLLWTESGLAGIIGILVVFTVVPIQSYTGKLSSIFRLQTAIKTDERVRLMDEIISGVQVIKMYAWEKPFCVMVALARKLELKIVRKNSWIRGIFMTFNLFTTRAAIYCTLISMIFFGEQLTAEKVFVFASYFNILSHTMSAMFVRGVAEISECRVAVRRLQHFLLYDETIPQATGPTLSTSDDVKTKTTNSKSDFAFIDDEAGSDIETTKSVRQNGLATLANDIANIAGSQKTSEHWAVKLNNVTARWDPHSTDDTLHNLQLTVPKGKLYIVIGSVGSGKSSLISAILGELFLAKGKIDVKGKLSYASQEAWVFGSTVRQNIIFGADYDRQRYQKVVRACALLSDFKQFPQGDMTIVGERGSSLSGGQKARINLARAVYRQADIYILDDPLSAVDTHVGKHLFEECLQRYLSGKTRILATHQLQYIKDVDGIVLLEHGSIRFFNTYVDLLGARPEYSNLLASDTAHDTGDDSSQEKPMRRQLSNASTKSRTLDSGSVTDLDDDTEDEATIENLEGTSRGVVKGSIFFNYFRSGANWFFIFTVGTLFIVTQALASYNDFFMKILTNEEEMRYNEHHSKILTSNYSITPSNITNSTKSNNDYDITPALPDVYIYTGIVLSIFFVGITRSLLFYVVCVRNSQRLHDRCFEALIRTGMRFFDTNPSGRILNRFSKDMGAIDELLPKALLDAGQIILMMVGSLVVICAINPIFLGPLALIAFIFYWIRKVYLRTSKNVKRLEGMLRSPVFTHLNATLNGLTTIRAYGAQNILKAEFDKFQDTHSSAWYMFIVTSTAFGFSLDVFCFIFTTIVTFSFLLLQMGFSGAEVGLAITTSMAMTGMIQWGMRQGAEVTNQMMSVERVLEYTLLPPEDNVEGQSQYVKKKSTEKDKVKTVPVHPPATWPSEGCIRFHHVYMRYSDDDQPVLKGLDLVIKPREKVGIVGRTGAGKSSLISALFRLAKVEGVIEIDGVDTGSIFLEDLRRNISIIPQDPVLFSGTLRKNLDPFGEFKDDTLWSCLEEVELKDSMVGSGGLDSRVYDRGTNFSAGQRQLVCLARAILRNNKILLLDEATANVDPHTDGLIQRTIRTKFANCTVLTVAHRLNTIMDSDKVLVMDKGRMTEFDHPHLLLQNEYGTFTGLVKETGRAMTEQLMGIAKHAYEVAHGTEL